MLVPRPKWNDDRPEAYFYGASCRTCYVSCDISENSNTVFEWMHKHWEESSGHSRFFKYEIKRGKSEVRTRWVKGVLRHTFASLQLNKQLNSGDTTRDTPL